MRIKKLSFLLIFLLIPALAFAAEPDDIAEILEPFENAHLQELRDNATATNRTNMIDKAITGVSTAAMGLGGMQLAQGLGEQSADRAAAAEMQRYLNDLYCTYGANRAGFGAKNVSTANAKLDLLREDYAIKALKLKNLKGQLGIKPGVESELEIGDVVYDTAGNIVSAGLITNNSDLYDDAGVVRSTSAFGRLSSALQDETGQGIDAQMLAAQQQQSQARVTGGAIAVASGVAVSVGGHLLNEKFGAKDRSAEINAKYAQSTDELRSMIARLDQKEPPKKQNEPQKKAVAPERPAPAVIAQPEDSGGSADSGGISNSGDNFDYAVENPMDGLNFDDFDASSADADFDQSFKALFAEIEQKQAEVLQQREEIKESTSEQIIEVIQKNLCSPPRTCVNGRSVLGGTLFATNSSVISAAGKADIKAIADAFGKIQGELPGQSLEILVNGFTDNTGTDVVNNRLSQARADSVRAELVANGISSDIVIAAGMGKSNPVCPANNTADCRQQNRRVEIQVSEKL